MYNYNVDLGGEQDTGAKSPAGRVIYGLLVDTGALPNTTSSNVAHSVTNLDANEFFHVLYAWSDGADLLTDNRLRYTLTATNLVLTSTADLSAVTASQAVILYTKTDETVT